MKKILATVVTLIAAACGTYAFQPQKSPEAVGLNIEDAEWTVIGDNEKFTGFQTKADPSKIQDGGNPNGQNTVINDGDRVSIRDFGNTILGTATTTAEPINTLHTFRRRNGENILMRTRGTYIEYYEEGNDTWESVSSTYASGLVLSFADYNINTDQRSYTYFGNGVDPLARWTGAHTLTNGALVGGETTINVDDTSGFDTAGFIRLCDSNVGYSSKTLTTFVVTSSPACADNRGVIQVTEQFPTAPRGNLMINAQNRIFIAGITSTPQAVYFSRYGAATDFVSASLVTTSTASAAGIFNLAEGGGAVTGMALDEGSIYFFKKPIIYKATLSDSLYTLQPLKPFDGKSQTTGSVTPKAVFTGGNGVYFTTPDNQIMNLTRVEAVDYPQIVPISDPIKPTVDSIVFTSSTGISFKDKAYQSVKASSLSANKDTVLLFNERLGVWESPIVGWNVGDFSIYDDGTGDALYFGSSIDANVYKVTDDALDNALGVTANWRSKRFDFGSPNEMKEMNNFYIEGYISENTTLSISLLLDDGGFTQTYTAEFVGTESAYIFNADPFNLFGFHPFGFERFGSSDQSEKQKFRIYLNKNLKLTPFYNAQVEFASDGDSQAWEVTTFAFQVRRSSQPERRTLYRTFQ